MTWQRHGFGILDRLTSPLKYDKQITFCAVMLMLMLIPIFLLFRISGSHGLLTENISAILTSMKLGSISVFLSLITVYLIVDGLILLPKKYQTVFVGIFCLQILLPGALH